MQPAMSGVLPSHLQVRGGLQHPRMAVTQGGATPPPGVVAPRDVAGMAAAMPMAAPPSMPDRPIPPQLQQLPLQQQQQFLAAAQSQAHMARLLQEGGVQGFGIPPRMMHGGGPAMSGAPRVFVPAQGVPSNLHPMLGAGGPVGFVNGGGYVRAHMPFIPGGNMAAPAGGPGSAGVVSQAAAAPQGAPMPEAGPAGSAPDASAAYAVPLLAVSHPGGLAPHAGQLSMHASRGSMPMNMLGVAGPGGPGGAQFLHPSGGLGGFCMPGGPQQQHTVGLPAAAMLPGGGLVLPAQGVPGMGGLRMQWPQGRLVCVDGRIGQAGQALQSGGSHVP